ncbi:MAG: DUF1206 domain-containing protein [Adhaeribacter sp.]
MNIPSISPSQVSPAPGWSKILAKVGFVALGIVYCLVGALAFMAAFELGGKSNQGTDQKGAFQFILDQHYGRILLGLVALGLVCYALWRLLQAILDPEKKGHDAKGIARRIGYASSGLFYASLAFYAGKLAFGETSGGSQGDSRQSLARELLSQPFGQWLVGLLALGTMAFGLYQIYRALSGKYKKKIQACKLPAKHTNMLIRAGKVGYIARGVVWILIGYLFLKAALNANAQEAGGTEKAFRLIEQGTFGSVLLGIMALGLICYGVFMFVRARSETINPPL